MQCGFGVLPKYNKFIRFLLRGGAFFITLPSICAKIRLKFLIVCKMRRKILVSFVVSIMSAALSAAQDYGVKTNIIYDLTSTVNLGLEYRLADRWTFDMSGNYNAWTLKEDARWKHWMVQPEIRFWNCDAFSGHFVALHAIAGQYNFGGIRNNINYLGTDFSQLSDYRFQGYLMGGGIAYGYAWILGRHLNLEAELGLGYIYTKYDKFNCVGCGKRILAGQPAHYVGPTKVAVNLVYIF